MVACSDYFTAMLTGKMRESGEKMIQLKGITATGLEAVVKFAYTGTLNLDLNNLQDVLAAATHLQIAEAVELCCKFMHTAITVENCVDILNLTELYTLIETRQKTREYIMNHFDTFADSTQYSKLNHHQLNSMLKENGLKVISEYKLFELVLKWINQSKVDREKYLSELMYNIRLPLLSGEELVDKASRIKLMKQNSVCNQLLTDAKDYHIVISKQPLLQTSRTQVRSDIQSLVMCYAENLESYNFETHRHAFLKDAPVPLYNSCVCVVDNFMYACGGKYDSNENNEIATARCFRYDPRFDSWYELSSMNEARKDFVLQVFNNVLYAIAGQDENMVMCTVECFSIDKNDWETKSSLNNAVYGHAGAICGDLVYVSGGQKFDGYCNNVLSYNPITDIWHEECPLINARSNHEMVELSQVLYVIGGNTEDSYGFPVPTTSIEIFRPRTQQWTLCKMTLNIREAGACVIRDEIYVVGGINGQHCYSDLIQRFNPKCKTVELVDKFPTRIYGKACSVLTLPQYV